MKLARIEINNFRCFERLGVDLHPELNVIVGANGAGKTALLDAVIRSLEVVVNSYTFSRTIYLPSINDLNEKKKAIEAIVSKIQYLPDLSENDFYNNFSDEILFNIVAFDFYKPSGNSAKDALNIDKITEIQWSYKCYKFLNGEIEQYDEERYNKIRVLFAKKWNEFTDNSPVPIIGYYHSPRVFPANMPLGNVMDLKFDQLHAFAGAMDAGANFQSMLQWFYQRENQELREKFQIKHDEKFEFPDLKAVRNALRLVVENIDNVYFDASPPKLKVEVKNPGTGPKILALDQLSQGYRTLLSIVMDFARRLALGNPTLANPLEAKGILLIDEIELHLHPVWQQRVLLDLRRAFPNTQIIVTTHSPAVVTTARRENLILLGTDHQLEQLPDDIGTYGAESSKVLAQVFGVSQRPEKVETTKDIDDYLLLIENGQHDSKTARDLRAKIEKNLGVSDPILLRADLRIKMMGRQKS